MSEVDARYAAELSARKAFRIPDTWEEKKRLGLQNRGCSSRGCCSAAKWMIARNAFDRGAVRYACDPCKVRTYPDLEEAVIQ